MLHGVTRGDRAACSGWYRARVLRGDTACIAIGTAGKRERDEYSGAQNQGFFLRNAAEFDQWAMAERVRLRALATRAASAWTAVLEATGRISDAVAAAERALELSPTDESACRDLVRLLIASGNCAQAEAAGRRFIERLALDLGLSPSAETMRVVREAAALAKTDTIIVVPGRDSRHHRGRTTDSVTAGIITQGRYHWHQRTRASIERAIAYFTRAADRDARAVDAECGLADSWIVMGGRAYMPVEDAIEHATASAERALALDDTVSAVHTSIGGLNILRRRWDDAASALRRAIQIDPHNADAHHWLSLVLTTGFGARSDAHAEQAIAARLNPVAPMQVCALGWYRYLHGDYDSARLDMEPAVDLNADFEEGHAGLARVAARLGEQATVRRTIADGLARRADLEGDLLAEYASALAVLGEVRGARRLAAEAATHRAMPLNLALAWASVGDAERAFECLERESYLVYWAPHAVWWDPRLDVIRDDARFDRIRQKVARVWSPEW
jgi:tetratricopeptide (TPR) repeat protein